MIDKVLNFIKDNTFSIITAIIALIALYQTNSQIKTSNKQYLFERRIKNFSILLDLVKLYKENEYLLKERHNKSEVIEVDFLYYGLINNSYLEELHYAIEHPLEQPYQKEFLKKLEELNNIAKEIQFIYEGFADVSKFVLYYKEVLHSIYKYKNLQNIMIKDSKQFKLDYKQCQKNTNEPMHRDKLITSYNNLISSYERMEKNKSIKNMQKQIKL